MVSGSAAFKASAFSHKPKAKYRGRLGGARVSLVPITVGEIRTARLKPCPSHSCLNTFGRRTVPLSSRAVPNHFQEGGGSGSAEPSARASDPPYLILLFAS